MHTRGLFIVLEGSDGSGKTTQFNLLKERLKAIGYDVAVFDFPRYNKGSTYFVKRYLNGEFGPAQGISPYTASLFYALDRYEAAKDIEKALADGKIVLANRYVGSNMAHQGAKFTRAAEQRGFFVWADNLEFQLLGIPRADINIFLRVPADISYDLIAKKSTRNYTASVRDEHEQDKEHLKKSIEIYDLLCELFPKDFSAIDCTKNGKLMNIPDISNLIWSRLKPVLPSEKPHPSHSVVVTLGLNNTEEEAPDADSLNELWHHFKDASLLMQLQFQRLGKTNTTKGLVNWRDGGYKFFTPQGLPKQLQEEYKQTVTKIADLHQELHRKLSLFIERSLLSGNDLNTPSSLADLLLPITPLSALTDPNLSVRKSDVSSIAAQLLASDQDEVQWAAKQIYLMARQKWPDDFSGPLESKEGPESLNDIISKIASERMPQDYSVSSDVHLLEARPRLEFDLLAESIYPFTNLSLEDIAQEVSDWPYIQKYESLKQAASQPELLSKVRYKMDIISNQVTLSDIVAAGNLKDVQVQAFTPRYGFEVPEIIELAGADDTYNECFDESVKLYSLLQGADREDLTAYATLLGHRVRWQLSTDARGLKDIIEKISKSQPVLADTISEKISEVHPLLWEIISGKHTIVPNSQNKGRNRVKPHKSSAKRNTRKKR